MSQASFVTIASICLTVHSAKSPGGGCCMTSNGFSLTQTYPVQDDDMYDRIPSGADCDPEISGTQAQSADGKAVQDMSVHCEIDRDLARVRTLDLILPNGTNMFGIIIYHTNGTIDAECVFGPPLIKHSSQEESYCFGPDYHADHKFAGTVTYGSLIAERYAVAPRAPGAYIDLDVDHGCIPIRMLELTITNVVNSDPAESLFAIPPECFQQGAKIAGPVKHSKRILPFPNAIGRSSLFV